MAELTDGEDLSGFLVPATREKMLQQIGPHSRRNAAFAAYTFWQALQETPPPSRYRLRTLLTPDSPMWLDDLAEARSVLAHRSFTSRVSDPAHPEHGGLTYEKVYARGLSEVHARFTESDAVKGPEAVQAVGTVGLLVKVLVLRKVLKDWRAHEIIHEPPALAEEE